jgi:hypothetical protein
MPTKLPDERQIREPGSMELDPSGEGVAIEETRRLIASSKVEGTPVFNCTGIGENYHPLPWRALTYDTRLGGYVVDIDKDRLEGAPRYRAGEDPFIDDEYGARVDAYYRTTPTI